MASSELICVSWEVMGYGLWGSRYYTQAKLFFFFPSHFYISFDLFLPFWIITIHLIYLNLLSSEFVPDGKLGKNKTSRCYVRADISDGRMVSLASCETS